MCTFTAMDTLYIDFVAGIPFRQFLRLFRVAQSQLTLIILTNGIQSGEAFWLCHGSNKEVLMLFLAIARFFKLKI